MHSSAEAVLAEAGGDFWRGVLAAGGFTAMPRWTRDPIVGVAVYEDMHAFAAGVLARAICAACCAIAGESRKPWR